MTDEATSTPGVAFFALKVAGWKVEGFSASTALPTEKLSTFQLLTFNTALADGFAQDLRLFELVDLGAAGSGAGAGRAAGVGYAVLAIAVEFF